MPVGVLTADYIDVWCNTATDTPHKIRVGDMIAVKWNADQHDREYTWCTVLATTHVASGAELTLMHEQAADVPGHPAGEPAHVTLPCLAFLEIPKRRHAKLFDSLISKRWEWLCDLVDGYEIIKAACSS